MLMANISQATLPGVYNVPAGIHKPPLHGDMELARLALGSSCAQGLLLPEILSPFLNAVCQLFFVGHQAGASHVGSILN